MADTADDVRKEMEKQLADLKKEVGRLTKSLSARGEAAYEELRDDAEDAYEEASRSAKRTARQVRRQAYAVSEAIKENPGTAATVLSSAGLLGFLIGLLVGQAVSSGSDRSRRWY